jgi:Niemann-Pick C1 protein
MVLAQNLTLSFSSESSIQDELNRESTADAITIVVNIFLCKTPKVLNIDE